MRKKREVLEEPKPKKYIDDIGKMAITLHVYIEDRLDYYEYRSNRYSQHNMPENAMRIIQRAVNKFLKQMKKSNYYYLCSEDYAENYFDRINRHMNRSRKEDDSTSVFLTWVMYQIHDFVRDVFPYYYDGIHNVKNYDSFYKSTLEKLLR